MAAYTRRAPAVELTETVDTLLSLRIRGLWTFFTQQDLAFWSMCFYLIVEYVRPQQSVETVRGLPLGQIALALALLGYVMKGAPGVGLKGIGTYMLLTYTGVILVSSVSAFSPDTSFDALRVWFSWVAIYLLIVNVVNTKQRFIFFALLWLMCNYYMSQGGARQFALRGFTFTKWGIVGAPGWFQNSGEFGVAMCMMFPIAFRYYLVSRSRLTKIRKLFLLGMPLTALLGVVGSSSRGALAGLAAVLIVMFLHSKFNVKTVALISVVGIAGWLLVPQEQKDRFSNSGEDVTSVKRKVYWLNGLEIAADHPMFGIGYENWLLYYGTYYKDSETSAEFGVHTAQLPHNIFIECMAELGYVGLIVFVLLILTTHFVNMQTRRTARAVRGPPDALAVQMSFGFEEAMWGYLVSGFFVTVLYYPFFWINLALSVALNAVIRSSLAAPSPVRARNPAYRPSGAQPAAAR